MSRYVSFCWIIGFFCLCCMGGVGCSGETPGEGTLKSDGTQAGDEQAAKESVATDGSTNVADASEGKEAAGQELVPEAKVEAPVEKPPVETPASKKKVFGGKRPVTIQLPDGYDAAKSLPLVVMLHGYGASGSIQAGYLGYTALLDKQKFLLIAPDGTLDPTNKRFWNATAACCDFARTGVDDVAYITGLIKEVKAEYLVDAKRVFVIGHSNGGFMAYRLACDASDQITAIVSLAGAANISKLQCNPKNKVSVLQIHGTNDATIAYKGGANVGNQYPSAEQSVTTWGGYNGCSGKLESTATKLDLDTSLAGSETTVQKIADCPKGISTELWTIQKGGHIPRVSVSFAEQTFQWFQQHSKP